jgi:HSP20 family protein
MAIVRFDPFRELISMQDRMNRMVQDLYGRRGEEDVMSRGEWLPPVDIFQNGQSEIVLKAELPGVNRDDIDLRVENNTLTIRGARRMPQDVREEQYHRVERSYGSFTRSFTLPSVIDTGSVRADYQDGVLTVTLPIREEAKPKQIQVQVNG